MAKETKYCKYFVVNDPDHRVKCGRPAHRVSEGRHYCREHFDAVIEPAKNAVLKAAVELVDGDRTYQPAQVYQIFLTMKRLKALGWTLGD